MLSRIKITITANSFSDSPTLTQTLTLTLTITYTSIFELSQEIWDEESFIRSVESLLRNTCWNVNPLEATVIATQLLLG
jgi:hypothetical protein